MLYITNNSIKQSFVYAQLNDQTVLFQTIQFSISTLFKCQLVLCLTIQSSINYVFALILNVKQFYWPIDKTLSSATILGLSGPGSIGNEEIPCISQSSCITGTSPSDCLMSYAGHSLAGVLPLGRDAVGVFYSPPADWACIHIETISKEERYLTNGDAENWVILTACQVIWGYLMLRDK